MCAFSVLKMHPNFKDIKVCLLHCPETEESSEEQASFLWKYSRGNHITTAPKPF
jgi:hypothetical protein